MLHLCEHLLAEVLQGSNAHTPSFPHLQAELFATAMASHGRVDLAFFVCSMHSTSCTMIETLSALSAHNDPVACNARGSSSCTVTARLRAQFMGTVQEVGTGVKNVAVGDRVVACFDIGCGRCFLCKQARPAALLLVQSCAGKYMPAVASAARGACSSMRVP